ncbi:MAG: hypothetical protein RLY16_2573 [Bacteroidota bacterium]|jgi:ABC-type multidrug transport system ATPase subunit
MQIKLTNTGKRFNREWIFRKLSFSFQGPGHYAITGSNGSGKSTLLQVVAGATTFNEGQIEFEWEGKIIAQDKTFQYISIAAPYLELIEEMTATELLEFHRGLKKMTKDIPDALAQVQLQKAAHKQIRYFSSGMKQRLKLAQAFFSETPVLLLDEPSTNLDADGIALYQHLIENYTQNRLVIISSNDPNEYKSCTEKIAIEQYKLVTN